MRFRTACSAALIVFLEIGSAAEAATEITATYRLPHPISPTLAFPFGNHGETPPAVRIAQTFTAEVDGWLQTASITATSLDSNSSGLHLAVTSLVDGQPGIILATSPLQGLYINGRFDDITALNATADFSGSQVVLEAQERYALLFVAERFNSNFYVLGDQTIGTDRNYPGGEILRSASGASFQLLPIGELMFEVTVTTIPEPATLALCLLAATACFGRARLVR